MSKAAAGWGLLCVFLGLLSCSQAPPKDRIYTITESELRQLKLAYASDYVSFVGRDDQGLVAFAMDNNRGQDGEQWQAEHFVVFFDEKSGWQSLKGNGAYPNTGKQMHTIPDSEHFQFQLDGDFPTTISSESNQLRLLMEKPELIVDNQKGLSRYRMGSAAAVLHWRDRTIKGRIIYEYLFLPAFNRLSRTYYGVFDTFQGIYALVDGAGDFYFHDQEGDFLAELTGHGAGFMRHRNQLSPITDLVNNMVAKRFAWGFYRWPHRWQGEFQWQGRTFRYELEVTSRDNIANWIIGGFAMTIIKGRILDDQGNAFPLVGFGELIM